MSVNYLDKTRLVIGFLVLLAVINLVDIYSDMLEGSSWTHILEETIMVFIFIGIIGYLYQHLKTSSLSLEHARAELNNIKNLYEQQSESMQQARKDYSKVIYQQFEQWKLTKSEQDVALLLLKGLSLKEVAAVREIKEKSVRQHASNIYSKANLTGRHELAAWFLDDFY